MSYPINKFSDLILRTDVISPYKLNYIDNVKELQKNLTKDIDDNENYKSLLAHIINSNNRLTFDIGKKKKKIK